ncbi:MAG: tetratricopeptide repeat protein, partial [Myxococcota bacterium]|nr:tetratricopeptide repeat protein [Myxococcota bacterium]
TSVVASAPSQDEDDDWDDDDWGDEDEEEEAAPAPAPAPTPAPEEEGDEDGDEEAAEEVAPAPAEESTPTPSEDADEEGDESTGGESQGEEPGDAPAEEATPGAEDAEEGSSDEDDFDDEDDDEDEDDDDDDDDEEEEAEEEEPPPPPPPPGLSEGQVYVWEAKALVDRGEFAGAEAKASLATTTPDGATGGLVQLARIRLRQGQMAEALDAVQRALDKEPASIPARMLLLRLGAAGVDIGDPVDPIQRQLQQNKKDLGLAIALAEAQLVDRRPTEAMRTARGVLKRAETSVTAMKLLARSYLAMDNGPTADSILEKALELEKDPEVLFLRGHIALQRGDLSLAVKWFDAAINENPHYVEALNNASVLYLKVENYKAAHKTMKKVVRYAPAFASAWLNLGTAQRGVGKFEDAEKSWMKALELDPDKAVARFN